MSAALEVRELSPRGGGAVAIVAVRGRDALARVRELCGRVELASGDVRLVDLRVDGERLDRALCVVPNVDEVELHLHGSPVLVERLLAALGGETERREPVALEARASCSLEHAPSESAARILLDQAEGALRRELDALVLDDDVARLERLVERSRVARFALEPARVVVAGPVNAGKSTLFNLLLGERRAIESAEPGTTRDVLHGRAHFGAYPVELFDGAGERTPSFDDAQRAIELAGQALAREVRGEADWIAWLAPDGGAPPSPIVARTTTFLSRADEASRTLRERAARTLEAHRAPEQATHAVWLAFREFFVLPEDPWIPGAAAAFDSASRGHLDACLSAADAEARRELLRRVLDAH
ncbi:MAG: 50S ribosome-binding GTPase [Planctomycetes bacterium]|nr:50S ribosome-binding GTPase [Planctomycetota bacterium]